ncbi:hypothetical protein [Gordonia tangerina]|uniref:Uncharacterized protein n=1 Tax=Gordonia tangerina TaxID=2911060 RepID=A0ABS9DMU7_9ACTN|nr:hypothetical protein [Gordonia tangerina]MCF3939909.1 hypothetical protein [Gordonia tangerina]
MAALGSIQATLSIESVGAFSRIELGTGDLPIHVVRVGGDSATAQYSISSSSLTAGVVDMLRAAADAIESGDVDL